MAKRIDFFDGAESETAPILGDIEASALVQYVSDGAYEAANTNAPEEGDIYYNTTLDKIRYYNVGAAEWRNVGESSVGFQETLGGTSDGINDTFGPLTYVPSTADSIAVFLDGVLLQDSEWTLSGANIVITVPPLTGQKVLAYYTTEGGASLPSITGIYKVEGNRQLTSGEALAKQITLLATPGIPSEVVLDIQGGGAAFYGTDFTISGNILTWNGLALDGILATGDRLRIIYVY